MAAIGEPEKEIIAEPLDWPAEQPAPLEPSPVEAPVEEPVPA